MEAAEEDEKRGAWAENVLVQSPQTQGNESINFSRRASSEVVDEELGPRDGGGTLVGRDKEVD